VSIAAHLRRGLILAAALLQAPSPAMAETLRVGHATLATTVDPHDLNLIEDLTLSLHLYETLTTRTATLQPAPGLAAAWTSSGPTTWTFSLRRGRRFSTGAEVTADDVVFSLCRILAMVPDGRPAVSALIQDVVAARALDAHTVELETRRPDPVLPRRLSAVPIAAAMHQVKRLDDPACATKGTAVPAGSGPYLVEEMTADRIVLVRSPQATADAVWPRVEMIRLPTGPDRTRALLRGEIDIAAAIPPESVLHLQDKTDFGIFSTPGARTVMLMVDTRRPPFDDIRLRRAVDLGLDRSALSDAVSHGLARPAWQLVPPGMAGHAPDLDGTGAPFAGAQKVPTPDDRPIPPVTLSAEQTLARLAEYVGFALRRAGITVTVEILSGPDHLRRLREDPPELSLFGWLSVTGEAGYGLNELLGAGGSANFHRFEDAELATWLSAADVAVGETGRDAILQIAARRVAETLPVIPIAHPPVIWAARAGIVPIPRADGILLAHEVRAPR